MTAHPGLQAVLDASALLAYLQGEPGSARVEAALDNAGISAVNLAEVLTTALHKRGLRISNFTA